MYVELSADHRRGSPAVHAVGYVHVVGHLLESVAMFLLVVLAVCAAWFGILLGHVPAGRTDRQSARDRWLNGPGEPRTIWLPAGKETP